MKNKNIKEEKLDKKNDIREDSVSVHKESAEKESKKVSKNKTLRKLSLVKYIKWIILFLTLCILAASFVLAKTMTSERRFCRDVVRGVDKGWSISNSEYDIQIIEGKKEIDFIQCEYNLMYKYKGQSFENPEIQDVAWNYISALEGCLKAIDAHDPENDYEAFWNEFSPYYGQRIQYLYKLYNINERSFKDLEKKHAEKFKRLILNGWAIEKINGITFAKTIDDKGTEIYQASLTNDSGYDIDFFNMEILLLSKKGDILDTTAAYTEQWSMDTAKTLEFYKTSKKVKAYKIKGVTCK